MATYMDFMWPTFRDFAARGRRLAAKQGSLRSPRGRLVARLHKGLSSMVETQHK